MKVLPKIEQIAFSLDAGDKIVARNIIGRVSPGEAQDCEAREPLRKLHQLRKKMFSQKNVDFKMHQLK